MKNSFHIIDPLAYEVARRERINYQCAFIHSSSWRDITFLLNKRKLFSVHQKGKKKKVSWSICDDRGTTQSELDS